MTFRYLCEQPCLREYSAKPCPGPQAPRPSQAHPQNKIQPTPDALGPKLQMGPPLQAVCAVGGHVKLRGLGPPSRQVAVRVNASCVAPSGAVIWHSRGMRSPVIANPGVSTWHRLAASGWLLSVSRPCLQAGVSRHMAQQAGLITQGARLLQILLRCQAPGVACAAHCGTSFVSVVSNDGVCLCRHGGASASLAHISDVLGGFACL